ncbi:hypothetical protein AX15_006332 [Amanita polypyramis BW_CC]|nr:hypothetical protein AX15_006332 [Amanita polypyramis BW_CC]
METYIPSSDLEESQATQLIQNVLGAPDPIARLDSAIRRNMPEDNVLNDSSMGSSSVGRSTHISTQYHLHGLGQTQSQVDDESGGTQEGSIDERGMPEFTNGRLVPSSDYLTKITRTKGLRQEQLNQSHFRTKEKPRAKGDNLSLRKSPVRYSTLMQSGLRDAIPSSRPRSSSPASQDSFVGDAEDPEKNLLSSAKQFQMPLSELGRPLSSGQRTSGEGSGDSSVAPHPPLTRSSHASHSPSKVKSFSAHTQYRHHAGRRGTTIDEEPDSQTSNISVSSSAPGSSLYERRDMEPLADDNQATQPTTQSEEAEKSDGSEPAWLLAAAKVSGTTATGDDPRPESSTRSDEARSNTSVTRSLFSLIHPKNRWRKQMYQNILTEVQSSNEHGDSNAAVQGSYAIQETQPSRESETENDFQPPSLPTVLPSSIRREKQRPKASQDAMDVVPDSEPSREEPRSLVPNSAVAVVSDKTTPQQWVPRSTDHQKNAKRAYEQSDDSDDDDVPLAKLSTNSNRRGRVREQKHKPSPRSTVRASGQVQESSEVPSSVPEQDASAAHSRPPRSTRTDVKAIKNGRSHHPGSNRRVIRRIYEEEEVEESRSESENNVQVKKPQYSESDEMADEDYEVDAQASSKKRKRGTAPMKAPTTRRKGPVTRGSKTAASTTRMPSSKPTKRPSRTASTIKMTNTDATRVFALWRQDGHFYSGTVHMFQPDNRFLVKFDDGTEAVVSIEQMRLCELHVGDDVLLINRTRTSKILDLSRLGDKIVTVDLDGDPEEVEIRNIRIASRTIKSTWKGRLLTTEGVIPTVPPIKTGSPAPSGVSLASAQSNKNVQKRFLSKTGLVVSLSAGSENSEKKKESLVGMIRDNGGVVLDDWSNVVRMEGKHTINNNRWVLNKDEVQWTGKEDIERVFLLADDSSQKPKFLMAIGLGIPCLSLGWLHDSISGGEEREWAAYMLPQGYSDTLSARISQQVDVDWGNSVHQLTDVMGNAVPAKVFSNKSILCIGLDMVPQPKGKKLIGTDEKAQEASNAVARIIICMGARRVETVTELRYASARASDYDYIVVKDSCVSSIDTKGGTIVAWSWVKDCLIASRRLPLEDETTPQEAY